jgi:MFS transporter, ACS family, hexuronate transporter
MQQNIGVQQAIGKYRWTICALVFFATTVNYLDRQVISLLKSTLSSPENFNWNDGDYTNIELAYKIAYAIGFLLAGRFIDRIGTKIGYALATLIWSLAAMGHALARGVTGFMVARSVLGISEAGNFPAAIKTVAEWFPKKERALATGVFNSGTNIGAIVAPLTVPIMTQAWGWQWAFIITGAFGLSWLILWFIYYEVPQKQKRLSQAEYDYIQSDIDEKEDKETIGPRLSWKKIIWYKQTWAFAIGKFLTDPIWWFYLFWLPDFLESQYGLKGTAVSTPVALVYYMYAFGRIGGGWIPLHLIKNAWPVFKAR